MSRSVPLLASVVVASVVLLACAPARASDAIDAALLRWSFSMIEASENGVVARTAVAPVHLQAGAAELDLSASLMRVVPSHDDAAAFAATSLDWTVDVRLDGVLQQPLGGDTEAWTLSRSQGGDDDNDRGEASLTRHTEYVLGAAVARDALLEVTLTLRGLASGERVNWSGSVVSESGFAVQAVPEPSQWLALGLGLVAIGAATRRRQPARP